MQVKENILRRKVGLGHFMIFALDPLLSTTATLVKEGI